jgi:four helix bundle protein
VESGKEKRLIASFEDMVVWQKSMDLVAEVYKIGREGELARNWGLRDQLQRAAVSIPANIAEGFERQSRKEYHQFITIAQGSAGELRCLLTIVSRLGLLPPEAYMACGKNHWKFPAC